MDLRHQLPILQRRGANSEASANAARSASFFLSVQPVKSVDICSGKAGRVGNIISGFQFVPIPHEVRNDVSAVSEGIHDVLKISGVRQTHRVAKFVDAGQINNRVAQHLVRL